MHNTFDHMAQEEPQASTAQVCTTLVFVFDSLRLRDSAVS